MRTPERPRIQSSLVFEHNCVEKLLVLGGSVLLHKVDKDVVGGGGSGEGSLIEDAWIIESELWNIVFVGGLVDDVLHLGVFPGVAVSISIVVWMWVDLGVDADSRGGGNKSGEFEEFHI